MSESEQINKTQVRHVKSSDVLSEIEKGNRFIVLEDEPAYIPDDYILINMRYKEKEFKTLVPTQIIYFLANPGEGSIDDALDNVLDFYNDVKDFEKQSMLDGKTCAQSVNWATTSKDSYRVYLINKLTKNGNEFDEEVIARLDLNDDFVDQRLKGIAALCLEKAIDEVKAAELKDLITKIDVNHVKDGDGKVVGISKDEFKKITSFRYSPIPHMSTKTMKCLGDSHYDLKPEYINDPFWDYNLRTMSKTQRSIEVTDHFAKLDKSINALETEIEDYRIAKSKTGNDPNKIGVHDQSLIRQYANLKYIAKENPAALLDIEPQRITEAKISDPK
jgi:hypothetical protein